MTGICMSIRIRSKGFPSAIDAKAFSQAIKPFSASVTANPALLRMMADDAAIVGAVVGQKDPQAGAGTRTDCQWVL